MNKSILIACVAGITGIFQTQAQLAITEVMSGEADKNHPDWFELHNYGSTNIDLSGYSWNDDSHGGFSAGDAAPFTGITIAPNETIIVAEQKGVVTDASTFRTWWGLSNGLQVIVLNAADPGLGASPLVSGAKRADSVRLWRSNPAALGSNTNGLDMDECSDYLVQRVDLGVTVSQSLLFNGSSGVYDSLSVNGVAGAFASATVSTDIGSPGIAPSPVSGVISQTPAPRTATVGDSVSFTNCGIALPPLVFHWYFNNTPITSQTPGVSIHHYTPGISNPLTNDASVLTLSGVQSTNAGTYTVIAENGLQAFTNSAVLTVNQSPVAPSILSYTPALDSFDGCLGQTVNFSILASGYPSPTFQWYKDSTPISGETTAALLLPLSDINQSGVYSVIVTNSAGGTNQTFTLHVTPVPNLVVTEVMSGASTNNSNGSTAGHGDWFELSNFGDFPVNLYGYHVDDSHNNLASSALVSSRTIIRPWESVVFVQDMTPAQFRTWWGTNLSPGVQIINYSGNGRGLSGTGDFVYLWNAVATANGDHAAQLQFFTGTDGDSFRFNLAYLDQSGFEGTLSTNGVDGAFTATVGGDIGSPGAVINMARLSNVTPTNGGFNLTWFCQPHWNYTIQYKTNVNDSTWTTLTEVVSGDANSMTYTDTTSGPVRFYRLSFNLRNQ